MRKLPFVVVASALLFAACGDSKPSSGSTTTTPATETTVPHPTLPKPTVQLPAAAPTELKIADLKIGSGEPAATGDQVVVQYIGVRSRDGVPFDNNYDEGKQPFTVDLGAGTVIKGWDQGLVGAKAGGQRQLDIPAALAYGDQAKGDVIGANENLSFVIDVLAVIKPTDPAKAPTLVIAPSTAATAVSTVDLITGSGAVAVAGANATFDYIFYRGDTGQQIASSWQPGQAATIPLNPDGNVDGIVAGLIGMKVGGRRQVTIPAAQVFAGAGNDGLGLPAGVDLIVVVDMLATY